MSEPLFTVVIPTFNREHLIEGTINSVLRQDLQDFEIVIVDDGSNDSPDRVVARFNDDRIRLIRQPNAGGGAARNNGIQNARGQYIAFLDSDDSFLPNKLSRCATEFPISDDLVLYSAMNVDRGVEKFWIRPDRAIRENEDVGEYLFCANQLIQTSTIVLSTKLARRVMFDPTLRRGQDLDFCIRLQAAGAKFRMIEEPLTIWLDNTETGRTSYVSGYETSSKWLEKCQHLLTKKALLGYRATVLGYHLAPVKPFAAAADFFKGWAFAGVSSRTIARQLLRAYMPRAMYRAIVNRFVARFGRV
jgi:glycosyltransferase involved in cell wall biosynthesis